MEGYCNLDGLTLLLLLVWVFVLVLVVAAVVAFMEPWSLGGRKDQFL